MLALLAGTGRLPPILTTHLEAANASYALYPLGDGPDALSLNTLGTHLEDMRAKGCDTICLAGAINRRALRLDQPDEATKPLVPALVAALSAPDGSALSKLHALFEDQGFRVCGAHEIVPSLVPDAGILTNAEPTDRDRTDAERAMTILAVTGPADIGQGCIVENGQALAIEALPGTDFMLATIAPFRGDRATGGVFAKAAKPGQDMRSDMPAIGPETADGVIAAGLAGIVIQAGDVMVLDRDIVVDRLNAASRFLWVRP